MAITAKQEKRLPDYLNNSWFPVLCMLALVIIVFSRFLFSDQMLFSSDQMSGFDDRVFIKTSIEKYHQYPPLWVNTRLSGRPSIDALFGDVFYLPSFFINLLASVPRAIGMKMIFHIFLAGVFFFRRSLRRPVRYSTCSIRSSSRISIPVMTEKCSSSPGCRL